MVLKGPIVCASEGQKAFYEGREDGSNLKKIVFDSIWFCWEDFHFDSS